MVSNTQIISTILCKRAFPLISVHVICVFLEADWRIAPLFMAKFNTLYKSLKPCLAFVVTKVAVNQHSLPQNISLMLQLGDTL